MTLSPAVAHSPLMVRALQACSNDPAGSRAYLAHWLLHGEARDGAALAVGIVDDAEVDVELRDQLGELLVSRGCVPESV